MFNELNTNLLPFLDVQMETERSLITCLKSHSYHVVELGFQTLALWLQNLPLNHYALLPPGQGIESTLPNLVSILTVRGRDGRDLNFLPLFRKAVIWCFRMERCILSIIHSCLYFLRVP